MILFRPDHVQPILDGAKIKTRRRGMKRWNVNSVHRAKIKLMRQEYFALLRILTLHQEPLGAMTEKDAWEEGGYTLSSYREVWEKINGRGSWDPGLVVWVVQFERVFNLGEICGRCLSRDFCRHSDACCIQSLFGDSERYVTPKEIVEFCCKQRCHHTPEYHDQTCSIKRAGVTKEYLSPARSVIKALNVKDEHGFIIKRLTDYSAGELS